ncbi:MAG TPA: BatD family protein [Steroidobacteraceae bacterium]|jgi:hypothetical protein
MGIPPSIRCKVLVVFLGVFASIISAVAAADATADAVKANAAKVDAALDAALTTEIIEPSRIKLGDTAEIRVSTLYGRLKGFSLPTVPGLEFQIMGRQEGLQFINGRSVPASYILIRVTPKFTGVFTIPGLTPRAKTLGLEVVTGNEPNPFAYHNPSLPKLPVASVAIPKRLELKAGGAAFVQLVLPKRAIYVGESVPVDIEVGIRPGIVTTLNGPPTLTSSDFTLNELSQQPIRRDQVINGNPFEILTWHTLLGAVKAGDFSLAVEAPLSVRDVRSAEDSAIAAQLGWPFSQIIYKGLTPKEVKVPSPAFALQVLSLPQGQPVGFSGAVGDFQVKSDISPQGAAVGEPQTLRLHVTGAGNFDRVNSTMLDHLDHWKTYPVKSAFTPHNVVGYSGEKVFEQPLIAERPGEQSVPALEFSYFNPNTQKYESASTQPIALTIGTVAGSVARSFSARGLRPDHAPARGEVSDLRPLYFQAWFLSVPTTLALILAVSLFAVRRPDVASGSSKAAGRVLGQLEAAAQSGDSSAFFQLARQALLQAGSKAEEVERLTALAEEAKYSGYKADGDEFQRWISLIRVELTGVGG